MFSKTAATLTAAALIAVAPASASAFDADEPVIGIMDNVMTSRDFAGLSLYSYGAVEIDVLRNDTPIETQLRDVEIVIDSQPWGGHNVKVLPGENGDHDTIMFTVNEDDVTSFVGTQFTYRVRTPSGNLSPAATVLVAPIR